MEYWLIAAGFLILLAAFSRSLYLNAGKREKRRRRKPKKNFWSDGISDREFIMMISVSTFFVFAAAGMVISAIDKKVSETYLDILQMTVPPLMTIIGSVFAVEGVELFTKQKTKKEVSDAVNKHMIDNPGSEPEKSIEDIAEAITRKEEEDEFPI